MALLCCCVQLCLLQCMLHAEWLLCGAYTWPVAMSVIQLALALAPTGLWDPYRDIHMGECAELCARHYGISREQQDQHAITSHQRAQAATASGAFLREIVPVEVAGPRGRPPVVVSADEGPSKMDADKLHRLKPYFAKVWGQAVAPSCVVLCCHLWHTAVTCHPVSTLLAWASMWAACGDACSTSAAATACQVSSLDMPAALAEHAAICHRHRRVAPSQPATRLPSQTVLAHWS